MLNLADLPEIDFVEADAQNIEKTIFALYTSVTGRNLAEGDPIRLFLLFICDVIIRLLEKLNYTGKQNLLKYAEGDKLENLGALVGVTRIPAGAASAAFQIRLSEARDKETIIPKGTRIGAEGDIYFLTANDVVITAGNTSAQVTCLCNVKGVAGNGYKPGEISRIIDPVPYVKTIENISTSEGGSDVETDAALRERIFEAPESYSCAGPEGQYIFQAKSTNSAIIDAAAYSPSPGVVNVVVLLTGGIIPENTIFGEIEEKLSGKTVRPMCEKVEVVAPEPVSYQIDVKYWLKNGADPASVSADVYKAVEEYRMWQRTRLGRDINPDELIYRLKSIGGVKRVLINSPEFVQVKENQVAQDKGISIAMTGSEDE